MKLRTIFWFWMPLAFSWLMMTFEGPWIQGVIARKADPELQLAAFGLVISLSVLIESPVIMFLAVSSALTRDRQAYRILWRYVMIVNVIVTVIAALMAFTPLLDLYLGRLLGIPQEIVNAARPGMAIMILFSAFIGYRRFHQGILINHNRTHTIGTGTLLRIIVSAGVAMALGYWSDLPGAVIGSYGIIFAVFVEMAYVHYISRPDVRDLEMTPRPEDKPPLTLSKILHFHIPLALTSVMTLFMLPVLQRGLASTPEPEQALAAFPVVFSILLIMRAGGFAWQEVVITLSKDAQHVQSLRRFTLIMGGSMSATTLIFATTPMINIYTGTILDVPDHLMPLVVTGVLVGFLTPLFTALQSYLRGMLMRADTTDPIYQGMGVGFIVLSFIMWLGLRLGFDGIPVASAALTGGAGIELLYLYWAYVQSKGALRLILEPIPDAGSA